MIAARLCERGFAAPCDSLGYREHSLDLIARASTLTGKTISLSALGEKTEAGQSSDIALSHVTLTSTGKTSLLATGKIGIDPGADYSYDHWTESHSSGGWFRKKTTTIDHVRESTTVLPSSLRTGALDIHAEGDIRLVATKIDTTDKPSIRSNGNIEYLAAHHQSYAHDESRTRKSLFGVFTYGRSSSSHTASGQTALVTSLQSAADVFSYSAGNTTLEGTRIVSASGKVEVLAGQNLDIRPAENTAFVEDKFQSWSLVGNSLDYALNHKVKDVSSASSTTLTGAHLAGNSVELMAGGNAHLVATTILGQTGATVMAGGTVLIEAGKETFSRSHEHQESGHGVRVIKTDGRVHVVAPNENFEKLKDNGSTATPVFSVIDSAKGAVTISGGLDVALLGTKINAATDVNLTADQRLLLGGALATTSHDDEQEKGTVIGRMRDGESLDTQTGTVVPGSIDAGGKVNLTADAGVELGAVAIRSGGATVFGAPSVSFVAERSSDYLSHKVWDKDRGYEVNKGDGHVDERLSLATIDAKGGLTLPETTKVSVQLDGHLLDAAGNAAASTAGQERLTAVSPEQFKSLANQLSLQPGMAYLADLAKRTDIDWQAVSTAHQKWDYKTQGLTQTGAIVLTVVVAILTYGAGAEMLTAAGSTTTSTAAGAAAGTTVTTTTGLGTISTATTTVAAGGAATTTTVVVSTAAGAAASAAVTSLATSAAISFANNGGDLGSSETIRGMVSSMLTAGVGQYFSGTYNLESFAGKIVAGCAAGELSGAGCKDGAASAAVWQGLAWAGNEMRQNQIENSRQFKGICIGNTGNCENNLTKPSVGVDGDNMGVGGGRWDIVGVCGTQGFECKVDDGIVRITGHDIDKFAGTPSERLQEIFKANGADLLSLMGGIQGGGGYLRIFGIGPGFYEKGSFWDKWVVEPFGGTHDQFNSYSTYDTVNDPSYRTIQRDFQGNPVLVGGNYVEVPAPRFAGNIRPDTTWMSDLANIANIPLASPFAAATIMNQLPPGYLQVLDNAQRINRDRSRDLKEVKP